jgi:hypothetical protein
MARIRTIKPEFWSDEKLSECSLSARLLFIGIWTYADDEGRMEYQPARIRMQVFPCGSVSQKSVNEYLGELTERSLIRVYVVDGKQYLDVPNFAKHQKINRPTPSRFPEFSVSAHGDVTEPSPLEGKGKEGSSNSPPRKKPKRTKTQIPDDFALTDELRQYAVAHLPDVDPAAFFESFRGKALAKGWAYANWDQALQEFVRNCAPNSGHWAAGQYPKINGSVKWM